MKRIYKLLFLFIFIFGIDSYSQSLKDSVLVPNIFTPNADGLNDVFKPQFTFEGKIQSYKMEILDRFGIKILETNKSGQHWDGRTTSGTQCPDGTYFYIIHLAANSNKIEYKGFVQLIR